MAENFGSVLKRLREGLGLSQIELATESGITQNAISRYEAEGREPNWESAVKLANALGVSLDVFRGEEAGGFQSRDCRVKITLTDSDGNEHTLIEAKGKLPR